MFKPILEKSLEGRIPSAENSGGRALQYRIHLQGCVSSCKAALSGRARKLVNRGGKDQLLSVNVPMPPPASSRVHKPMVSREAVDKQGSLMPNVLIHLGQGHLGDHTLQPSLTAQPALRQPL